MALRQEASIYLVESDSSLEREAFSVSPGNNSSVESIPSERDESNLMEDPGTRLLEKQQEDALRAVGRFPGERCCIFSPLDARGKRLCLI